MIRVLIRCFFTVFLTTIMISSLAYGSERRGDPFSGPRRQIAIIIFSGLGGAVLGLSTLSFYSRPQDYFSNIAVGFALGTISGTAYATYRTARHPRDFYGLPKMERELPLKSHYAFSYRREF